MRSGMKGDLAELKLLSHLVEEGREVCLPYGNRPGYDILVRGSDVNGGRWLRVQVKTAYKRSARNGKTYIDFLRGSGKVLRRQYTSEDFDYLAGVDPKSGEYWMLHVSEVTGKRCTTVDGTHAGYLGVDRL